MQEQDKPKHRIRVAVSERAIPGAPSDKDGNTANFTGYGLAGIYFPNGESEHVVSDKQLAELKAARAPLDAKGRKQKHPFTFLELPSHEEEKSADEAKAKVQQPVRR